MDRKPILSIISTILGGVSLLPFLGIASLPGLAAGIVGYVRERHITGIIGIVLSIAGIATSPTVWALLLSIWLRGYCMISDCSVKLSNAIQQTLENPKIQGKLKDFAAQGISSSYSVAYSAGWEKKASDLNAAPQNIPSIFANMSFFTKSYRTSPHYKAILMDTLMEKDAAETIDAFVTRMAHDTLRAKNPALQIALADAVKMQPGSIKINGVNDPAKDVAQLRVFSGTSLGNEEIVAFVDGGPRVFMLIASAPTHADMAAVWPVFYDLVVKSIAFSVTIPAAAPTTPTAHPAR